MRHLVLDQLVLVPCSVVHVHARELRRVSEVLDQLPEEVLELIRADPVRRGTRRVDTDKGRED